MFCVAQVSVLQVLESEGLAEAYPWNPHLYGMDVFYVAQHSVFLQVFESEGLVYNVKVLYVTLFSLFYRSWRVNDWCTT